MKDIEILLQNNKTFKNYIPELQLPKLYIIYTI